MRPLKDVLIKRCSEICSKFTGVYTCWSVISKKLQSNFTEITLQDGCSPVNLLHIFRTPFSNITSGWLLQWIWTLFSLFNPFLCFTGIAQTRLFLLNSAWIYWFLFSSALIIVLVFSSPSYQKDGREQKYDY